MTIKDDIDGLTKAVATLQASVNAIPTGSMTGAVVDLTEVNAKLDAIKAEFVATPPTV